MLNVPDVRAQSHDAAVVRCSACGAPRGGDDSACGFCGASFTLHEQDLNVICPSCFTRISAQAKFCHSCSTPIAVEQELGTDSAFECPVCEGGVRLSSRSIGETPVHECPSCAGLWISHAVFERAVRENRQQAIPGHRGPRARTHPVVAAPQKGPMYRKCPECSTVMNRENYGRRSGVIIDVCAEHGVWFDAQELEAILEWIRDGGQERRPEPSRPRPEQPRRAFSAPVTPSRASSTLDDVASVLFDLFF
ncbi:MAG: zf-TFIIB domain-containing protein [Myxococcota bacterium]